MMSDKVPFCLLSYVFIDSVVDDVTTLQAEISLHMEDIVLFSNTSGPALVAPTFLIILYRFFLTG
jgi:hypothetical protein